MRVVLRPEGDGMARFEVTNSMGGTASAAESTGLGGQLIDAFATQLDAEAEIDARPDRYGIALTFKVERVQPRLPEVDPRKVVLTSAAREGATH